MRYNVTNALFKEKSWYFRNALVRANYENPQLNVEKTQLPLEEFFKVLLFGHELELRNRYLRIGYEYGSKNGEAIGDLHRHDVSANKGGVVVNDVVNVVVNDTVKNKATFSRNEELTMKALLNNPRLSAARLAAELGVTPRQAQRIIAALKTKAGLRREGSDKNGRWVFGE